jgi:type IV pilus assembly protein PilN
MIRINLLPFRAARRRENIRQQVSVFVLLVICFILGLSYYSIHLDKKIQLVTNEIRRVDNEIAKYKEKAKKVNKIKAEIAIYERKVKTIKSLKSRRREVIVLLDSMTDLTIPEKMWLTNLNIDRANVKISGIAFDQKTVADFMTRIGKSPLFHKDVKLNNLKMSDIAGTAVQSFVLSCTKSVTQTEKKIKE